VNLLRWQWILWGFLGAGGYLLLHWLATRSVYYPSRFPAGDWAARDRIGAQDVWLRASDGVRLHAWWIERPGAPIATLYLHGNAGNITHREPFAVLITEARSSLLLLDYRGYGRSAGRPTEAGLYRDADAGYEWLRARGIAPGRIVVHGESLGTAVAVDLASRRECAGVVLASPFPSARAVARRVLPLGGPLLIWGFDSKRKIPGVRAPLLFIHGDRDDVIDPALGRELFAAAPQPKQFWLAPGAGHNDLADQAGTEYGLRLRRFYSVVVGR
jgi:fermentation-respiration switch protein FrsA (DUF1100 family)